jgi:hypothetical protein
MRGIFADCEKIRTAARGAVSLAEILRKLGLRSSGSRYAQLRAALAKFGIPMPIANQIASSKSVWADCENVRRAARKSATQKEVLERLGLSLAGKNYVRLAAVCGVYRIQLPPKWGVTSKPDQVAERYRQRWTVLDDEVAVRAALQDARSWTVAAQRLWLVNDARDRSALQTRCRELGLEPNQHVRCGILTDRDAVAAVVERASSIIEALTMLNLPGSSHHRLVRACMEFGLAVPRADRAAAAIRMHQKARAEYRWGRPEDVLRRDPTIRQRRVRNMVLRYNLVPYICAICQSLPTWMGSPLTLILDHINGDPIDHRLENLRFVCPNCESQLPTHGSKNGRAKAA